MLGIGHNLVVLLSFFDFHFEYHMKFIEINSKLSGVCGHKITFRVDCDVWIVTLVSKEQRDTSSGARSIIESELS